MATLIELFKMGYDIGQDIPRESRARAAARLEYGAAADDPALFNQLEEGRLASQQEARLGRQEDRQQSQFDRQVRAQDFEMQGARQERSQRAVLGLVNGLRSARDRGEDIGASFDRLAQTLPKLGVDPADIPEMRQSLIANPAVLDDYYATLTGQTLGDQGASTNNGLTPAQQKEERDRTEGQQNLPALTGELRGIYDKLNEGSGITTANPKSVFDSVGRWLSSSWAGRQTGAIMGTENESLRQQAEGARQLVIQGIKNATGMSAQELNSNFELQNMLRAATDPTLSYEANIAALNRITALYGGGAAAAPTDYTPGTRYRFKGGDPGDRNNYEVVQ